MRLSETAISPERIADPVNPVDREDIGISRPVTINAPHTEGCSRPKRQTKKPIRLNL